MSSSDSGFSLVELVVYFAVLATVTGFLVGILYTTTRIGLQDDSASDLSQQISFVAATIQRLVRDSSLVENPAGVASTTLFLRLASTTLDPTLVYVDSASSGIYLKEGGETPRRLTSDKVKVSGFSVIKYENPGSFAVVEVNLTLAASTTRAEAAASKTWRGAISRISAATFDSNLLASSTGYTIGQAGAPWNRIFLDDGAAGSPAYTFSGEIALGIFRVGSGILGLGIGGSEVVRVSAGAPADSIITVGGASRPGCLILGDSDGSGVTYITAVNGVVTSTQTIPAACQ